MSGLSDRIKAVLEQHLLEAGEGHYAGELICGGCHRCLGNPTNHLVQALSEALDPDYQTTVVPLEAKQTYLKESSIGFEETA